MGYYHVNDTGKGIYIKRFDTINKNYKLPPLDYIKSYLKREYGSCDKDLSMLSGMNLYHQIVYIGMNKYLFSYLAKPIIQETDNNQSFCKSFSDAFDRRYSAYFDKVAANTFELLFCHRFGYPFGCFKGISDYDGNIMFFCNLQFPPEKYNKKLSELTEDVFIAELREFFSDFLDDDYYKTVELEICEEYIKE